MNNFILPCPWFFVDFCLDKFLSSFLFASFTCSLKKLSLNKPWGNSRAKLISFHFKFQPVAKKISLTTSTSTTTTTATATATAIAAAIKRQQEQISGTQMEGLNKKTLYNCTHKEVSNTVKCHR